GRRLVRRAGDPLPAAIPRRQGPDFPQQRARPRGAQGAQAQGQAQGPPRHLEGGGGVGLSWRSLVGWAKARNKSAFTRVFDALCAPCPPPTGDQGRTADGGHGAEAGAFAHPTNDANEDGTMHEALNHAKLAMLFRKEFALRNVRNGETIVLLSDLGARR